MDYPKGAMGVHFVNLTVQGSPDPLKPNVLSYEPDDTAISSSHSEHSFPLQLNDICSFLGRVADLNQMDSIAGT
jgi:hypothetical protein